MKTALTFNTLHSNTILNYTTSRNLSKPPLQTIPTNPLSYSLISTNPNNTQQTITNNNQPNALNPLSTSQQSNTPRIMIQNTQFQIPNPPSTTIRTNLHIIATFKQPATHPSHMSSNVSNITTYNTVPPSTIPSVYTSTTNINKFFYINL